MSRRYLMALDIGGGSGRCLLVDVDTAVVVTARRDWSHPPAPGTAGLGYDLDTSDIWSKLGEASREVMRKAGAGPGEVLGIAATSMRNTTVAVDSDNDILLATPNQDARALGEAVTLGLQRGEQIHQTGGHWPGPIFTGSRLLWMKEHAPGPFKRISRVVCLSDWIGFMLGGGLFAERSQAVETLLFDLAGGEWSEDIIESLGLRLESFPETVDAGARIGGLTDEAASHMGLCPGIPVAAAGADTQCGILGAGAVEEGDICAVAGTTLPVQLVTGRPVLDPEGRLWSGRHVIPGLFILESNGMMAGSVLEWLAGILYCDYDLPLETLFEEAASSGPGAGGATSTFGAALFDARKIGIPVGNLSMSHMVTEGRRVGRRHVSRAVIEGVAYSLRANVEQLSAIAPPNPGSLRVCGGMSRSSLWTQVVSDVTGLEVLVPVTPEVTALGAAVCAGVGAGLFDDPAEGSRRLSRIAREHRPGPASEAYGRLYSGWKESLGLGEAADNHLSGLLALTLLEGAPEAGAAGAAGFRPRMLVTASLGESALESLERLGDVRYEPWRETKKIYDGGAELTRALEGCSVLVTEMDIVDFESIRSLPDLRFVISCRGNPVNVDIEAATAFGIPVAHTPGRNADAVADLTVAFMLMLARKLPRSALFLKEGRVEAGDLARMGEAYMKYQGNELWRKTVGIIGLGNVGRGVARRVRPFGAEILFHDPGVGAGPGALVNARKVPLDELLERSDFVTVHLPPLESTRNMLGHVAFSKMKKDAFFINTARASLVDADALAEALESGRLAGAALDVFPVEPPASDDRLVARDDVIATPHIGGNTYELSAHQGEIVVDLIEALLAGKEPGHILNPRVMEGFSWTGRRTEPTMEELERLSRKERPRMTS